MDFRQIKSGDTVRLIHRNKSPQIEEKQVDNVTKYQVQVGYYRFSRKTGLRWSGNYYSVRLDG